MSGIVCPTCGRRAHEGDFLCTRCETILDPDQLLADPEPPKEPTVVRALLAPPEATLRRRRPEPPAELKAEAQVPRGNTRTKVFTIPFGLTDVPTVVAGLDLKAQAISTFEAFALSMVDGHSSLDALRLSLSLGKMEIQSLVKSLVDRKLLEVRPAELPRKKAPEAPRPPPPVPEPAPEPEPQAARPLPPLRRAGSSGAVPPLRTASVAAAPAPAPRRPAPPVPPPRSFEPPKPRVPVPEHVYESPLQRAITLEKSGRIEEAIAHLERAVAVSSDPAPLYNRLALVLIKERRDLPGAEALLHKALELEPESDVYRQNLLKVLMLAGAVTNRKRAPRR